MRSFSSYSSAVTDLSQLGVKLGDALFVHASLKSVGPTIGGPRAIIEALLESVGERGLIAMPGFSTDATIPEGLDLEGATPGEISDIEDAVLGFDVFKSSTREMGVIAEAFRAWPGTVRSNHPTVSVTANGHDAKAIVAEHSLAWAAGHDTPFGQLYRRKNSKVLLIGVGWNRCTMLHLSETLAEIRRTKIRREKTGGVWIEAEDVADDLGRLFPALGEAFEATGNVTTGQLGAAQCRLCDVRTLVDFAAAYISDANLKSGDRA